MDTKFLSLLGLGITCRTYVTKSNCTPPSQSERCGKALFSTEFPTLVRTSVSLARCPAPSPSSPFWDVHRVRIPEKNLAWTTVPQPLGVCSWDRRFIEDVIQPSRSKNMSEAAVSTSSTFTIARPQAGEYAPYYERYISLIPGERHSQHTRPATPPDHAVALWPRRG